jgi:tetrahydromethanopterin S-methyltransferase subunit B
MGIVRVSDELGLLFDPLKGTIAETREDVIQYALDPLYPRINRLDQIADDLMNQLTPDAELMESYGNRGKASYIGGLYTNIWMGVILGMLFAFVVLVSSMFTHPGGIELIKAALKTAGGP